MAVSDIIPHVPASDLTQLGRWADTDASVIYRDDEAREKALECARGVYQRDVLRGRANLSGSDLQGTARSYAYHYEQSRRNLVRRLEKAGLGVAYTILPGERRHTLVVG